jgi:hypothetical protein
MPVVREFAGELVHRLVRCDARRIAEAKAAVRTTHRHGATISDTSALFGMEWGEDRAAVGAGCPPCPGTSYQ